MTAADKRERKFNMYFRDADEKIAAAQWAKDQGHSSLNSYFLWLYRNDKRNDAGGRLASLEAVKQFALENRVRTAIEDLDHEL